MNQLLPKATVKALRKVRVVKRRRQEMIVSMKITRELYKRVQALAKKLDRTQSWIMREAVTSWVIWKTTEKPPVDAQTYQALKDDQ